MDQGHSPRCPGRSSGGESRIKPARLGGKAHAQVNGDVAKWRNGARIAQSPTLPVTASIPQDGTS